MYLAYRTQPDIVFIVGQLSRYNYNPRVGHIHMVKQVFQYLKGTIILGFD